MLKLKRLSEGQWFDYLEAPGVRLLIRPLHLSTGLALRSKVRERAIMDVPDPKSHRIVPTLMEDVDTSKFSWEVFNYILVDFEGISIEGLESASKEDIKRSIFDESSLRDFILDKSEWLGKQSAAKLGEEIKNSDSSQIG